MSMRIISCMSAAVLSAGAALAGGQLGYGDLSGDLDGHGLLGGIHAGDMWGLGSFVTGAEVDYEAADIEIGDAGSLDSVARLKLRSGFDMGRSLFYATAGWARADAEAGGVELSGDGRFGGLGMAYRMNGACMLGGEILSHRFEDFDGTGADIDAATVTLRAAMTF